jgi:AcrR family transcriptional regulator
MTAGQFQTRERRRVERHNGILDAAEAVFLHKGFEAATMEEVADRAAVAKGTLYLYFPSKEDLFLGLSVRIQDRLLHRYGEAVADAQSGIDQLFRITKAFYEVATSQLELFRLSVSFWLDRPEACDRRSACRRQHVEHKRRLFGMLRSAVERGQLDGTVRDDRPAVELALLVWAGLLGGLMLELQRPRLDGELGLQQRCEPLWSHHAALLVDAARPERARHQNGNGRERRRRLARRVG